MGAALEQLVFGWNPQNAAFTDGYGPIHYSCDDSEARAVYERTRLILRPRLVQAWPSIGRMPLSGNQVMVFRRAPLPASEPPATYCHALVGDAQDLPPWLGMALHYWDWPLPGDVGSGPIGQSLSPVDAGRLRHAMVKARELISSEFAAQSLEGPLTTLLAHVLTNPRTPMVILDTSRGQMPTPLLYRIAYLLGPTTLRDFGSFSTFESEDVGAWQTAFVPEWPNSVTSGSARIDLRRPVGGPAAGIARRLVTLLEHDEEAALDVVDDVVRKADGDASQLLQLFDGMLQGEPANSPHRPSPSVITDPVAPPGTSKFFPHPQPHSGVRLPAAQHSVAHSPVAPPRSGFAPSPLPCRPAERPYPFDGMFTKPYKLSLPQRVTSRAQLWMRGAELVAPGALTDPALLARVEDYRLIDVVTGPEPLTDLALKELWRRRPYRSHNDNQDLCAEVLKAKFYVRELVEEKRGTPEYDGVDLAAALFDIFVRPRPRSAANDELLRSALKQLWDEHGEAGRAVVQRIVFVSGRLNFADHVWRMLLQRAMQSTGQAGPAAARPVHTAPQRRPRNDGQGPEQPPAGKRTDKARQGPAKPTGTPDEARDPVLKAMVLGFLLAAVMITVYLVTKG